MADRNDPNTLQRDPNPSKPVERNPAETRPPLRRGEQGFREMNREAGIEFDDINAESEDKNS